jgi:hypothetical protein
MAFCELAPSSLLRRDAFLALRELEAFEVAEIFEEAYGLVQPWWDQLGALLNVSFDAFVKWYPDSDLDKAMLPLTRRLWEMCGTGKGHPNGLLHYWVPYARKYPYRVVHMAS